MNYSTIDASGLPMKSSALNFQDNDLVWSIDAYVAGNTVPSSSQLLAVSAETAAHPLTELSALHPNFCYNTAQIQSTDRSKNDSAASSPAPSVSYEQLQYRRDKQRSGTKSKGFDSSPTKEEEEDFEIPTTDDWIKSKQRRREQNRNAQRAHRRRKEAQIESLNAELEIVRSEKEDLKKLCSDQHQEIVQLKSRIAQLANQLKKLCLS